MSDNSFNIKLQAVLDKIKSIANIKADIKAIESKLPKIKLQGTLNKTAVKKELDTKLKTVKPKVKIDADTTQAEKKIEKIGKQKTDPTITPKVDNTQAVSSLKQAQKETKTLWERFTSGIAGINLIQIGVQKVVQAIHQAIAGIKELDAIKTNIQMVSNTSDSGVNAMMSSYNAMAKELSSTTKNVAEAANEFLRMGESIENTNELIRSSQVLSQVGMIESSEAASYLVSSLKGYQVAAEDSMDIVSKLTSVDLEAAVSAGGLAEALSKCSNIANNSGVAMDRLIGYTATVGETTQKSMSEVGNSFQALLSRMNNIKIGRFIDDETGESLSDTEAVLNKLGIQLRDTEDSYRSFDAVLDDIGSHWKDFTKVEQNAISVAIAGTRQRENFEALMNNYGNALRYAETAANSAGSALERYGVYQDSIQAKTNELTAAIESLSTNVISEELYGGIIEATTGLVEFIDKTSLLKGTLAGLVTMGVSKAIVSIGTGFITAAKSTAQLSAAMALFDKGRSKQNLLAIGAACKGLSDQQLKLVLSTKGLIDEDRKAILTGMGVVKAEQQQTLATLGFTSAENAATASTFSFKGALNALKTAILTNPIGTIATAVSAATIAFSVFKQHQEDLRQSTQEAVDKANTLSTEVAELTGRYLSLSEAVKTDETVKEDLISTQNELLRKLGLEGESIDGLISKYGSLSSAIKQATIDSLKNSQVDLIDGVNVAKEKLLDVAKDNIWGTKNAIYAGGEDAFKAFQGLEKAGIVDREAYSPGGGTFTLFGNEATIEGALENFKRLEDAVNALRDSGEFTVDELADNSLFQAIYSRYNEMKSGVDAYSSAIENLNANLSQQTMLAALQGQEIPKTGEAFDIFRQELVDTAIASKQFIGNEEDIADAINNYLSTVPEFEGYYSIPLENELDKVDALLGQEDFSKTFPDALEKSKDIQSSISTLRSALDAFNSGTIDESAVLDLMQQFPELTPYIDLAAEGFGNLSEGLSVLIAQQPEALIQRLEALKESLNTEEERAQVDLLINSLQALSSYGDTGMEAYATTIGSTWSDTVNVIESVTTQFENLVKVQEAVADGLTMSTTAAAELAKMYPEILTNAEYAGNGQITLNEEVVNSILDGDKSIIDAQIAKLEADKAELEARKETAIAELEIANQVGVGKGQIDEQTARNKIDLLNQELENEISKNNQVGQSYAQTAESMADNTEQLGNYEAEVANNMSINMNTATASMADGMATNSEASQYSLSGLAQKATDVANAVLGIATGDTIDNPNTIYKGKGGTNKGGIKTVSSPSKFTSTVSDYLKGDLSLDGLKSGLEIDISSYEKAISNIDAQIDVLKNLQSSFDNNGGIGGHGYSDKIKDLEKEKDKINSALDDAKKGSTKETKDKYQELVDFFERRNKVLNDALSLLKTNLDNVTGAFAKNNLIDAQLGVTEEKFKNYSDALNMYTQKANEALSKLPSDIAAKIKDGAVDLTTFVGDGNKEVVEAIKDYEQWADKVADCKQELAELRTAIRQLELDKFNNIMEEFQNQFDLHEDGKGLISKQIDLLKEAGQLIGESFFTTQIDQSKKQLELLEAEKAQLVGQMNSAIGSGRVQKASDEWLSMVNALSDVEGNILDCKKAIEEFDNELLQLHWDVFDRIQGQFKDLDSELSNLRGLFEDSKVADANFNWSKEALAQLGLLAQQYELARYQVQQYNDEINQLNKDYLDGRYSATEYADKLSDLSAEQWEAVNASESIRDAIMDLNEVRIDEEITSIEKEIDAYRELIDAQIDALKSSKDLHGYQQLIAEKTKSVTDLEHQIAAMANDDSAATVAKRKQLEEQLAQARKELEEAEYDHSIEAQEEALNKQYEQYEEGRNAEIEALRASLEEREQLIAESFEAVKQNADTVGQEIARIATEHGVTVSNAIITSWQNGEMAVASYGAVLSEQTSAFIGNLIGVEYEVYNLQAQANETANTLAWMFSTRADTLVSELASSYYSEQNLNAMTQALRDSLVRTLEGGYNISSITSALDSIAGHLNGVASAANSAANAISSVGAAQSGISSGNSNSSSGIKYYNTNTTRLPETVKGNVQFYTPKYVHYASGTRNAKGGLRAVNEEGAELTLPKLPSGNYAIGNEGDQILTKEQTDNIYEWSKVSPDEFADKEDKLKLMTPEEFAAMRGVEMPDLSKLYADAVYDIPYSVRHPKIDNDNVYRGNNVNIHYDNMVNIQGDVNDANHVVKQIESVASNVVDKAIKKSWHDFEMTRKYGIY